MKISKYIQDYTSGENVKIKEIFQEFKEFLEEIFKLDWKEAKLEFSDVLHFLQMYLYWTFKIDGGVWKVTQPSLDKFMGRLEKWRKLYALVGLDPMISNFCGNCNKEYKVVKQLGRFGVSEEDAKKAFRKVIKDVEVEN